MTGLSQKAANDLVAVFVEKSILKENNVYFEIIGFTQNEFFEIEKELKISINDLFKINNQWYNNY